MPYVDPNTVVSPKASWKTGEVIMNTGQGGWSVAHGKWLDEPAVGIRWNGSDNEPGYGNPQSRGYPTWFILPLGLQGIVLREVDRLNKEGETVICKITRPNDYDVGAWRIEATLKKETAGPVVFSLPKLPERLCRGDKGYLQPVDKELCGVFVDGKWFGDLYSNGVQEDENSTELETFQDAFVRNVKASLTAIS